MVNLLTYIHKRNPLDSHRGCHTIARCTVVPGHRGARFRAHLPRGRSLQHDACRPRRMAEVWFGLWFGLWG